MIKLMFPCKYIGITQAFRPSSNPKHVGIDLGHTSSYGGPNHDIISPGDGTVIDIRTNYNKTDSSGSSYGNYIQVDLGSGVNVLMAHLKYGSFKVKKGDKVKKGQLLAKMGNTGHSTGTHLHYEVRINGVKHDPLLYNYVDKTYVVSSNTAKKYKILSLVSVTSTVKEDKNKDQIKVLVKDLNVRENSSVSSASIGYASLNGIYNILDTKKDSNFTWYKIATNQWLANNGDWCRVTLKEDSSNDSEEINELHRQIDQLNNTIERQQQEITKLKEDANYKFIYQVLNDGNYKIKLYKDETLCIK